MENEKPKLTKKQIQAYTLTSPEFQGLTTAEAAKAMGITEQAFNRLLQRAEENCPQLFPILSQQEVDVLALLKLGWSNFDIAVQFKVSEGRVSQIKDALHAKGRGVASSKPVKMLQYAPHMDSQIKEKF